MGAAFNRWLAKAGTLHFLRRLVASDTTRSSAQACATPTRISRRHQASSSRVEFRTEKGGAIASKVLKYTFLNPGHPEFNAPQLGLQMSLNSGVAILDKNGDSSQAFSELVLQSDVSSRLSQGKLLVDLPEHRENAKLWVEILQFRQRIYGSVGAMAVWRGMQRRYVDLPVEGPEADTLWTAFIDIAIGARTKRESFEIFRYAQDLKQRTGLQYPYLYKSFVGGCFRLKQKDALFWHGRFAAAQLSGPQDQASVILDATCASNERWAFKTWLKLAAQDSEANLYDIAIGELLKLGDPKLILRWHQFLIADGYAPSTPMFNTPGVQKVFEADGDRSLPMIHRNRTMEGEIRAKDVQAKYPQLTRASMNEIVGDVYGIKPKKISDSFCARLFATQAFSLDLVIKGLSFLSIEVLGPLALREMVVRTSSLVELRSKLNDLERLGIKADSSVYAQLIKKAVRDDDKHLWKAILETDQHPDVFEDAATQDALLAPFLEQKQFDQAHLSLTALSFTTGVGQHHRAWNRVLQSQIVNREYDAIRRTVESLRQHGLPLTLHSLTLLRRFLLPERRRGKRAVLQDKKPGWVLRLVRNACMHTASRRHYVPINLWVELLKRYGMGRRWLGTEMLALWLLNHYATGKPALNRSPRPSTYSDRRRVRRQVLTLRLIFSPVMLRALLTWGIRSASPNTIFKEAYKGVLAREPWARGLALLRRIQDCKLFDVTAEARTSFQQRMWVLFGTGYSTLPMNNLARLYNRISLAHYINHANEIWPGLIDWVKPELLQEDTVSDPQLLVQFFGIMYRTKRRTGEYANVAQWAQYLSSTTQSHSSQPTRTQERERAWNYSPFRMVIPPDRLIRREETSPVYQPEQADTVPEMEAAPSDPTYHPFPPPEHQSPAARSSSWRPPPSPRYIPAPP